MTKMLSLLLIIPVLFANSGGPSEAMPTMLLI